LTSMSFPYGDHGRGILRRLRGGRCGQSRPRHDSKRTSPRHFRRFIGLFQPSGRRIEKAAEYADDYQPPASRLRPRPPDQPSAVAVSRLRLARVVTVGGSGRPRLNRKGSLRGQTLALDQRRRSNVSFEGFKNHQPELWHGLGPPDLDRIELVVEIVRQRTAPDDKAAGEP
jgi:hypothetical protein